MESVSGGESDSWLRLVKDFSPPLEFLENLPFSPRCVLADPRSRELLRRYAAGEGDAAEAIFDRYVERLLALARERIGPKLRSRVEAEDVVQSAYRSFFVGARDGEFELSESGDLWRLLASITLNKLYRQFEKQTAAKRSIHRETTLEASFEDLAQAEPSVAEIIAMGEQLQRVKAVQGGQA